MSTEEIREVFGNLTYEEMRVAAREVADARRAVREHLEPYKGTPEYQRLTVRSHLAYLTAISYVLGQAEKAGDTERVEELGRELMQASA